MIRNFFALIFIFLLASAFQGPLEMWLGGGEENPVETKTARIIWQPNESAQVVGRDSEMSGLETTLGETWPWIVALAAPNFPRTGENGFLRKIPQPHTNDLGAWALFLDGKVEGPYMFKVTAYNHADPYTPGKVSASGVHVFEGMAACGSPLNLGDVVVLENGMVLRCLDRGNGGDWWVDVYLDSLDEAREFGVQMIRGVTLR